ASLHSLSSHVSFSPTCASFLSSPPSFISPVQAQAEQQRAWQRLGIEQHPGDDCDDEVAECSGNERGGLTLCSDSELCLESIVIGYISSDWDKNFKRETRFTSHHPPHEIIQKIEGAAKPLGFDVHRSRLLFVEQQPE
ncbi:CBL-interacting serine/threonine-protein kinase 3, partial [Dionaea muscipula]